MMFALETSVPVHFQPHLRTAEWISSDSDSSNSSSEGNMDANAPGIPTKDDGFKPAKNWDGESKVRVPNGRSKGYPFKDGSVWVPTGPGSLAHGGPHWDVQFPDGSYTNVYPGGRKRGRRK